MVSPTFFERFINKLINYLGVHNAQGIRVGKLVQSTQPPGETMFESIEQY